MMGCVFVLENGQILLSENSRCVYVIIRCMGMCGAIEECLCFKVMNVCLQEAQILLCKYRELMRTVLEDSRLVRLQLEGGAALSRLRKEDTSVSLTEDYR